MAVLLQAVFAGYEIGFISSNPIRVRHLAEEEGVPRASHLLRHLDAPDHMLTTLLIWTSLVVTVSTLTLANLIGRALQDVPAYVEDIVSTLIIAPILLLIAEIIPKSIFRTHPTPLALAFFPIINFFHILLWPITAPVTWMTWGLLRLLGGPNQHISPLAASIEDVRTLVAEGVDHGTIEPEEQEMIDSVIDMQTTTAREIMVPRISIEALPDTATRDELIALFAASGRTRIPIYKDTVDTIIGVVNAYSVLMDEEPEREDIARLVRDVMHVPDTIKVGDLFRAMKTSKQHLAIVTDEYGGTDGLITMEDILEEIFGEIQDEYDHEERRIHKVGPNAYTLDARVPLEEMSELLGVEIVDEDVETIGGWIMHVAGHIPAQGEVLEHGPFRMTVLVAYPTHVSRIRLEVLQDKPPADDIS